MTTTLVVVGLGYVGLPMALRAAESGLKVYGLDTNATTVDRLNAGHSHIDDVSDDDLSRGLAAGFEATPDPPWWPWPTSFSCVCPPRWPKRVDPISGLSARPRRRSAPTSRRARWPSSSRRPTPARPRRFSHPW